MARSLAIHMTAAVGHLPDIINECFETACGIQGHRNFPHSNEGRIIGGVGKGVVTVPPSEFYDYEQMKYGRKYCARCLVHYRRDHPYDSDIGEFSLKG